MEIITKSTRKENQVIWYFISLVVDIFDIKVLLFPLPYQIDIFRSKIKEVKHKLLTKIA